MAIGRFENVKLVLIGRQKLGWQKKFNPFVHQGEGVVQMQHRNQKYLFV